MVTSLLSLKAHVGMLVLSSLVPLSALGQPLDVDKRDSGGERNNDVAPSGSSPSPTVYSEESVAPVAPATDGVAPFVDRPNELPFHEGEPAPEGYRLKVTPRTGLAVGGGLMVGGAYGVSVAIAVAADDKAYTKYMVIPIVGPLIALGRAFDGDGGSSGSGGQEAQGFAQGAAIMWLLVMDSLVQAGGTAMVLAGTLTHKKQWVRGRHNWAMAPQPIGSGYGIGVTGQF